MEVRGIKLEVDGGREYWEGQVKLGVTWEAVWKHIARMRVTPHEDSL